MARAIDVVQVKAEIAAEKLAVIIENGSVLLKDMQSGEAVKIATLPPPNEPLTLNELREMDGEPVWVDDEKTWAILQVWDDQNIDAVFPIQRGCFRAESVLGMKIYRRPPEGEEYT